jgi:hypothetical protein
MSLGAKGLNKQPKYNFDIRKPGIKSNATDNRVHIVYSGSFFLRQNVGIFRSNCTASHPNGP